MVPRAKRKESLEALLVAELTDNDGWSMLVDLTDLGYKDLADRFRQALHEEHKHLESVRHWLSVAMQRDAKREMQ